MESDSCNFCCQNSDQFIFFSCAHKLCFKCFPYLLLNILQASKIASDSFLNNGLIFSCIQCQKGICEIPTSKFSEIVDFSSNFLPKTTNQVICNWCETAESSTYCQECQLDFCEKCLDVIHKTKKSYQSHHLLNNDQKVAAKSEFILNEKCLCSGKLNTNNLCQDCGIPVCNYCIQFEHYGHRLIDLKDFLEEKSKIEKNLVKVEFSKYIEENFIKFQSDLSESLEAETTKSINDFSVIIEDIIKILLGLKEKFTKKIE